jgi:DNA-binding CsgD family transcriptional regulator
MAHNAMLTLARKDDFFGVFNMCRSEAQGPFEEDALRLFSPLYPHLRRALQLGFRLDAYKAMQRAQFDVLDRLSVGIILLDRAAKVVFANAAARAMSADDGVLRLQNSAVTTATAPHGQQLEQLIQAAMRHLPVGTMSIPRPRDGRLVAIVASSIRGKDIDRFSGIGMRDIAAMLFISDPARPPDIPAQWIMDVYGLTLAEARVALCAASGSSIAEVAHNLNVSSNTVKTHLRQIVLQDRCKQTGRTGRPYREAHAG